MNENRIKRNDLLSQKVIKGLESRGMAGYYVQTKEEALSLALSMIPEGATVSKGGSMSVKEIGLSEALAKGNYKFTDRDNRGPDAEDPRTAALKAYDADVYLCSTNAITEDGVLVNIDGNANSRNEQNCPGRRQCTKKGKKRSGPNKHPALWPQHTLLQNRLLHELQKPRHNLLPVPDYPLFKAPRPHTRNPRKRSPRFLKAIRVY